MTFEDLDISFRAQASGGKCLYVPSAVAYHHGTATIGVMSYANTFYTMRNGLNTVVKNVPSLILLKYWCTVFKNRLSRAREFAIFGSFPACIKGMVSSSLCLPSMMKKRFAIQTNSQLNLRELDAKLHRDVRRISVSHLLLP